MSEAYESYDRASSGTLAMHETLELHELLAMQSNRLVENKKAIRKITDQTLCNLYLECIQTSEKHIREMLHILQHHPLKRG